MRRPACVAAALVGLVACQDREPNWEAFAISQYVDGAVGDSGRDEHGWVIVEGRRANESAVIEDDFVLTDQMLESVRRAVEALGDSAGLGPGMGEVSEMGIRAWRASQGVVVSVSASRPSAREETAQVFDDALGRLVTVPAYRDYLEAAYWIAEGRPIALGTGAYAEQDIELYAGPSWLPHDIVDVEGDGGPDIVLLEVGYESRQLVIFSIVEGQSVLRWEGLGRGL